MIAIVIPVGPGRQENLTECLLGIEGFPDDHDLGIVLVGDGVDVDELIAAVPLSLRPVTGALGLEKHVPGMEQPRNQGVRYLCGRWPEATHVWFVDSDVVLEPWALDAMSSAIEESSEPRIIVGPYDWLPEGWRPGSAGWAARRELRNDPRWPAFETGDSSRIFRGDLIAGLACFSGNLVWPIEEFRAIGGFWSELHHGRCEDGELGLRAVAAGVGISMREDACGYHLWHPVDTQAVLARNERDVPMLEERHPWATALIVTDQDGKAFAVRCFRCGQTIQTIQWWTHIDGCHD